MSCLEGGVVPYYTVSSPDSRRMSTIHAWLIQHQLESGDTYYLSVRIVCGWD